jgi:caspase domain-containing protein
VSGQRRALIIANDEYEQEALRNLLAPAADAEALGRVLGDAQIGDFAVQVVRNEPSHLIQAQIEELFSESRSDDVLLLHFSGHGLKSESGELFFAAPNTRPNRLGSTAVSADFVQRCMRATRSRSVVLLLDCCYGGAFGQGSTVRAAGDVNVLDSFPQGRLGGGRGRAVITASNAMQYAFEGDRLTDDQHRRPSVFTSALVEGLSTGDADRDEDGWVSLDELYDYVFDKVQEQNPHQTPSRHFELEGELYVARSRRRRIRPAPIPPDLEAAITDRNMFTRRGAVSELQSRLASEELPVAAGAYEALAELAHNDIRYVADPAAAALSQAAVRPEETELHFGERQQGSAPPHRLVRLLGPPIARACAPCASHDWIGVNETTEGFDISVDTTRTGTLRGSVDLKGPTGTAVIAVDVELLPQAAQTSTTHRPSRPANQGVTAPAISADQPKGRSAAEGRQKTRLAGTWWAAGKGGQDAAKTAQPQAVEPYSDAAPTADESAAAPESTTAATPSTARPPIRRGAAYAGTVIALLAGIAGLISLVLLRGSYASGVNFFFNLAIFAVPVVVAVIALVKLHRLTIIGFLQGMWWLAAPALAADIVTVTHLPGFVGDRILAATFLRFTGDALGVIAAIFLLVSWSPAVGMRRAPPIRALPVMLLGAVGFSQIAALIVYVSQGRRLVYFPLSLSLYIMGGAGVLVGLAVTWYALSLRARALGGALVLGWVTVAALALMNYMTQWSGMTSVERFWNVLECVLLAAVVVLTIFYVRGPSDLDGSAN